MGGSNNTPNSKSPRKRAKVTRGKARNVPAHLLDVPMDILLEVRMIMSGVAHLGSICQDVMLNYP
jgi:hypothetical protein